MEAIKNNKRAYLSYDRLVIEGKNHWFDEAKKEITEIKPKVMCGSEINNKLADLL